MDSIVKVKRVFRNEENHLTNQLGEKKVSRSIIDLRAVSDYEEYKGELAENNKNYTLVLLEYNLVTEYKIIDMDFDQFHDLYSKWRRYIESKEGIAKMN